MGFLNVKWRWTPIFDFTSAVCSIPARGENLQADEDLHVRLAGGMEVGLWDAPAVPKKF
jgi:hypothetical protein